MVNFESPDYPLPTKTSCTIIIEVQTFPGKSVNFILETKKRYRVNWGDGCKDTTNIHTYNSEQRIIIEIKGVGFTHFTIINNQCQILCLHVKAKTLEELDCSHNSIFLLDLTGCHKIKYINCSYNHLPKLDLAYQLNLHSLECKNNQLINLDFSNCQNLIVLNCQNNYLQTINITNCEDLNSIDCSSNELSREEINNLFAALPFQGTDANAMINLEFNPGFLYCDINKLTSQNWHIYKEI